MLGFSVDHIKLISFSFANVKYENYYDHTYHPSHDSVTWSLDYDKISDFDDVAGHWHLQDHPTKMGYTRVFYACDIKFKNPIPPMIMNFLTKAALKNATGWVKRESEEHPLDKKPPAFVVEGTDQHKHPIVASEKIEGNKRRVFFFGDKPKQLLNFPLKPDFGFRKG